MVLEPCYKPSESFQKRFEAYFMHAGGQDHEECEGEHGESLQGLIQQVGTGILHRRKKNNKSGRDADAQVLTTRMMPHIITLKLFSKSKSLDIEIDDESRAPGCHEYSALEKPLARAWS